MHFTLIENDLEPMFEWEPLDLKCQNRKKIPSHWGRPTRPNPPLCPNYLLQFFHFSDPLLNYHQSKLFIIIYKYTLKPLDLTHNLNRRRVGRKLKEKGRCFRHTLGDLSPCFIFLFSCLLLYFIFILISLWNKLLFLRLWYSLGHENLANSK